MIENSTQVFGPPGCGKTEFLMRVIEGALSKGTAPERIAFVSFSRKSIEEARCRALNRFSLDIKQLVNFRTLHSTGYMELGLSKDMIMSSVDYSMLGKMLGEEFVMNVNPDDGLIIPTDLRRGSRYLQIIDRSRYRMVSLEEEWKDNDTFDLSLFKAKQIQDQLIEYKSKLGKVDFADMVDLFIQTATPRSLDILIVDEAQDLTPLQWVMVSKMAEFAETVWLAGDDDQAIHRWTGVDVHQFIDMSEKRIILDQSYRLPQKVFEIGERIVKRIKDRVPKAYKPTDDEGKVLWHYDLDSLPLNRGSWTIMARTNGYVTELSRQVREMGYYYSVKGSPPISVAQARAIQTWRSLSDGEQVEIGLIKGLYDLVPKQGDKAVVRRGAAKLLDSVTTGETLCMDDLVREFGMLGSDRDAFDALNLGQDMRLYLQHIEASGEDITKPPRIKLSTFHAMKGGEDDNCAVYLATTRACEESRYPDDEHRAFYVGVTRARKELHLIESNKRYTYPL